MVAGDKCYMVSDRNGTRVLLDALAKAFRENYPERKPSVIEQSKSACDEISAEKFAGNLSRRGKMAKKETQHRHPVQGTTPEEREGD